MGTATYREREQEVQGTEKTGGDLADPQGLPLLEVCGSALTCGSLQSCVHRRSPEPAKHAPLHPSQRSNRELVQENAFLASCRWISDCESSDSTFSETNGSRRSISWFDCPGPHPLGPVSQFTPLSPANKARRRARTSTSRRHHVESITHLRMNAAAIISRRVAFVAVANRPDGVVLAPRASAGSRQRLSRQLAGHGTGRAMRSPPRRRAGPPDARRETRGDPRTPGHRQLVRRAAHGRG